MAQPPCWAATPDAVILAEHDGVRIGSIIAGGMAGDVTSSGSRSCLRRGCVGVSDGLEASERLGNDQPTLDPNVARRLTERKTR
jgi:hypothetical protein